MKTFKEAKLVESTYEVVQEEGYGKLYRDLDSKKEAWRFWSSDDPDKLKPSLLMILCSGIGFEIAINDTAYKTNKKVALAMGRGIQYSGGYAPSQGFWVSCDGKREEMTKPETAINRFFELWKEHELGEYWVDMGFGGSGCSSSALEG